MNSPLIHRYTTISTNRSILCIPFQMTLATNRPLYEEEWFHGVLPREEVVRLLKNEGDFLVRETIRNDESQIVLSVCWNGHKHFIVQTTVDGHYRFEGPAFPSIQELIMHQSLSELPVTSRSGAVLKKPVLRERWELSNDDVILLDKIGRVRLVCQSLNSDEDFKIHFQGNFGDVYKSRLKSSKLEVAVKTCRMTLPDEQKRKFLQEGRILKQYDHPNIVKLIGICVQKQPIMIVMELVPGGSLLNFLRKNVATLNIKQLISMCRDAAAGLFGSQIFKFISYSVLLSIQACGIWNRRTAFTEIWRLEIVLLDMRILSKYPILECHERRKSTLVSWEATLRHKIKTDLSAFLRQCRMAWNRFRSNGQHQRLWTSANTHRFVTSGRTEFWCGKYFQKAILPIPAWAIPEPESESMQVRCDKLGVPNTIMKTLLHFRLPDASSRKYHPRNVPIDAEMLGLRGRHQTPLWWDFHNGRHALQHFLSSILHLDSPLTIDGHPTSHSMM